MSAPQLKIIPAWATDEYSLSLLEKFSDLKHYRHGQDFGTPTLSVTFSMDAKLWREYRDKGWLGSLYGIDLGNFLSRSGVLNEYVVPIVSDRENAKRGRKTIRVEYRLKGHPYGGRS